MVKNNHKLNTQIQHTSHTLTLSHILESFRNEETCKYYLPQSTLCYTVLQNQTIKTRQVAWTQTHTFQRDKIIKSTRIGDDPDAVTIRESKVTMTNGFILKSRQYVRSIGDFSRAMAIIRVKWKC